MTTRRLLSASLSAAAAAAVVVGLGGCDMFVPQTTRTTVETSDGVSGHTGDVHVGNAVLITANGLISNLVVTLSNPDLVDHTVTITQDLGAETSRPVNVPAGGDVQLGTPGNQIVWFATVNAMPGSLHPLTFTAADGAPLHLRVPVLDGSIPQYQDLAPPVGIGITDVQSSK
jgi:hypothetical protein